MPSAWADTTPLPSGLVASDAQKLSTLYSVAGLLDLSWPIFTFPSARPKTTSLGLAIGHDMHVIGEDCGNLLQMLLL